MEFEVYFPDPNGIGEIEVLEGIESLVIVGANGMGKSHLGRWLMHRNDIEEPRLFSKVKRIPAQKNLGSLCVSRSCDQNC